MNAIIIAPASVLGVLFSFLLLKRASRWNARTVGKIRRVTAIVCPVLFGCLLYMTYISMSPWQVTVIMVASAFAIVGLVKKWIATEASWESGARVIAVLFVIFVAIIHGIFLADIAANMMSTKMDEDANEQMAALGSKDSSVREKAAQALGQRRDDDCTASLVVALDDPDEHVRTGAANALSDIGDKRVIGALVAADKKHHSSSNCAFCAALRNLRTR